MNARQLWFMNHVDMLFSLSLKVAAKLILLHNAALVEPIVYLHVTIDLRWFTGGLCMNTLRYVYHGTV